MQLSSPAANQGFGLTTAQIFYHIPDHKALLQEFIWQHYDVFPRLPELDAFLAFWERKIEGPIHSVVVAHACLITPVDLTQLRRALH